MKPEYYQKLLSRFPVGQYSVLQEVRDEAGQQANRSCDAMAFGLWPSRGCLVHGIEVKSNRGDWLREVKAPQKQESIFRYCDHFWLYATNETVVLDPAEIPATWGYMKLKGERVIVVKEAPRLEPIPFTRSFLASVMKRATTGLIHPDTIKDRIEEAYNRGKEVSKRELEQTRNQLTQTCEQVRDFEMTIGMSLSNHRGWRNNYTSTQLATAISVVLNGKETLKSHQESLKNLLDIADRTRNSIEQELKRFDEKKSDVSGD